MKEGGELTLLTLVNGYLSFVVPYFIIQLCTFGLVPFGLFLFPRTIGLFMILPYFTYTLTVGRYELKDGARSYEFSKNFFVFRAMRTFLRTEINLPLPKELEQAEKATNAQFLIAMFPHAVWSDYHVSMDGMWDIAFPNIYGNIRTLAASVLFRFPLVREWALWTSCIDASRSVAEQALYRGRTILVRPGGEAEQLRTTRGKEIVYLRKRKGFLRLAMSKGVPVVPAYVFGASDYHHTSDTLFAPREWAQKRFGICFPLAIGYWGSLCPLPVKTVCVLGKPLTFEMKKEGTPTSDEVDEAHAKFCLALRELFDEHKKSAGYADREFEIVL
jgi:1-acyl-sn-glycerol-3-phosphate acyltransferase